MVRIFIPPTEGQPNQVNPGYIHIAVILDRTGSMESIRDDTIGGFNAFLNEQKQQPGKATLTLVQFDSQDPYEVIHQVKTIQEVSELTRETYVPRASTPLLDAIGRGINDLEKSVADMKEGDRPSKVVFVVITDGQENASREFRRDQILNRRRIGRSSGVRRRGSGRFGGYAVLRWWGTAYL